MTDWSLEFGMGVHLYSATQLEVCVMIISTPEEAQKAYAHMLTEEYIDYIYPLLKLNLDKSQAGFSRRVRKNGN